MAGPSGSDPRIIARLHCPARLPYTPRPTSVGSCTSIALRSWLPLIFLSAPSRETTYEINSSHTAAIARSRGVPTIQQRFFS